MNEIDYQQLPRKRAAAGLLVFFQGRLLIVKPTYRPEWLLPGGIVEDHESPAACCIRETLQETGLRVSIRHLAAVDFRSAPGNGTGDSLHFLFTAPDLTPRQVNEIRIPERELEAYQLLDPEDALPLLATHLRKRVQACLPHLGNRSTVYCENGQPMLFSR